MKVKMITTMAGPKGTARPGTIIDVPEKQAIDMVAGKYAEYCKESKVDPVLPDADVFVPDNELKGKSAEVVKGIAKAENVEGSDTLSKKKLIPLIIEKRKIDAELAVLHQQCIDLEIEDHEDMDKDEMQAAVEQKMFDNNLGDRTECDDTCEYADGDDCNRTDGVVCKFGDDDGDTE